MRGWKRSGASGRATSKTGTATNSAFWNWMAVPGLPPWFRYNRVCHAEVPTRTISVRPASKKRNRRISAAIFSARYCAARWRLAPSSQWCSSLSGGRVPRFVSERRAWRTAPWRLVGTVRSATTHQPVPWASIDDAPSGQPPFFHTDADQSGAFELLTLPEPHRVRVSAPGYRTSTIDVGRVWFLWLPQGREHQDILLSPE